jgi:formylglycine-generating enzyme required for sulfatase activity
MTYNNYHFINLFFQTKRDNLHLLTYKKLLFLLFFFCSTNIFGNNIKISNTSFTGKNMVEGYTLMQFDLSWENSWRISSASKNWDAAWVFMKYRVGNGEWKHATLNNTGHNAPETSIITPASDGAGVFIYRKTEGIGTFSITGAQLRWNYGANGVADNSPIDFKVFAIEMVYVPQGRFYLGSGGTELNSFTRANNIDINSVPFSITSTAPVLQGNSISSSASNLSSKGPVNNLDLMGAESIPLSSNFPTGYHAFYSMKYEISQQMYVDFLNTLTRVQQDARTESNLSSGTTSVTNSYVMSNTSTLSNRNGIRSDKSIDATDPIVFYCDLNGNDIGSESSDGQWIANNHMNWMDGLAFADWVGLRPMTELEFEKASRGSGNPVANEFAWGNNNITAAVNITKSGAIDENADGNAVFENYAIVDGPLRAGIFATAVSDRAGSGASYYGIMELSGNVLDPTVTVSNGFGRVFTGRHGDGRLSTAGNANEKNWPGTNAGEVTDANGSGLRGGSWNNNQDFLRTSDRNLAVNPTGNASRSSGTGFRAVRDYISENLGQYYSVAEDSIFTISSDTDVLVGGMTITPEAGVYSVSFNSQYIIQPTNKIIEFSTGQGVIDLEATIDSIESYLHPTNNVHDPAATVLGNGQTMVSGVYSTAGALSVSGDLTLDGQGDPNAVFIFKADGAINTAAGVKIILMNSAKASNIFWIGKVAIGLAANTSMKGTLISSGGAIAMGAGSDLEGRMFTAAGAITSDSNTIVIHSGSSFFDLGILSTFVIFTGTGAIANTADSNFTGDIATHLGLITGIETTSVAGIIYPEGASQQVDVPDSKAILSVFQNGELVEKSSRMRVNSVNTVDISLQAIAIVEDGQAIEIRGSVEEGVIVMGNRILTLIKVR